MQDKNFHIANAHKYFMLFLDEMKQVEALNKPKRKKKNQAAIDKVLAKHEATMFNKKNLTK
jgi:hypothetical protein